MYVCLDTKIMIASDLEAEIDKNRYFRAAILKNGRHCRHDENLWWPYS